MSLNHYSTQLNEWRPCSAVNVKACKFKDHATSRELIDCRQMVRYGNQVAQSNATIQAVLPWRVKSYRTLQRKGTLSLPNLQVFRKKKLTKVFKKNSPVVSVDNLQLHNKRMSLVIPSDQLVTFLSFESTVVERIQQLKGKSLTALYQTGSYSPNNKGWKGHSIEKYLGLTFNNLSAPDTEEGEIKSFTLKNDKPQEDIATSVFNVTSGNNYMMQDILNDVRFTESHLFSKICRLILIGHNENIDGNCLVEKVALVDFMSPEFSNFLAMMESDWEISKRMILAGEKPLSADLAFFRYGTKGPGGEEITSRCFYIKKKVVFELLTLGAM